MISEDYGVALAAPITIAELAREFGGEVDHDARERVVRRLVAAEHASRDDELAVVTSLRWAARAASSPAVLLCQTGVAARCPVGPRWVHSHAMYVVARLMAVESKEEPAVDPNAWIDPAAVVHPSVTIGARAVVLSGARIGKDCTIAVGAVLYDGVRLGERVTVGPLAVLGRPGFGFTTSPQGELVRVPQRGGVVVEDDVEIGALATVDAGTLGPTILRRGVKLDAHVHVGHNVVIEEGTLVAAQAGFAGSARIGARVLVGGQVGIADHAEVGEGARIAAKSGVIGDVAPGAVVAGFPAVPRVAWLRAWARLLGGQKRRRA